MEKVRHKVFYLQMSKLDTKIFSEKLEEVFKKLDSADKINIARGFVLQNIENENYRYFYAYENNNLCEISYLLCTKADLITIRGKVEKFDIVEQGTQERRNTKRKFKLITNVIIFCCFAEEHSNGMFGLCHT